MISRTRRAPLIGHGLALLTIVTAGCELEEIVVPEGEPIIIVQAVMRPDETNQWILVEQSLTGGVRNFAGPFIPGDTPDVPVVGADVTVTNTTLDSDPCGPSTVFLEFSPIVSPASDGLYWSPDNCPTMRAGDVLELRVEYEGEVVTGRTTIPGADEMRLRTAVGGESVVLPGPPLLFNRDIDTLIAEVDASAGRALQIEIRRGFREDAPIPGGTTTFWIDSTAITVPGNLVDIFEAEGDGSFAPDVFDAGNMYKITVALTDQMYFDFLRSANSPLSGRGFINHLNGGFGLFGSIVTGDNWLKAVGNPDDAREGLYDVTGTVDSVPVMMEWELYLNSSPDSTHDEFSSFADGNWVNGPYGQSFGGTLNGNNMDALFSDQIPPDSTAQEPVAIFWSLRGLLDPARESQLSVFRQDPQTGREQNVGSLTVNKR